MPSYIYNLLETTYDFKVMVNNLVDDLLEKGHKFKVFEQFRTSLLKIEYRNIDDVIGLFYYYFQTQDHWLYKLLPYTQDNFINIEYNDFSHRDVLESKLEKCVGTMTTVPFFDNSRIWSISPIAWIFCCN